MLKTITVLFLLTGVFIHANNIRKPEKQSLQMDQYQAGKLYNSFKALKFPGHKQYFGRDILKRKWKFNNIDRGGFTFFDNINDLKFNNDDTLSFKLGDGIATFGWGNYAGKLPARDRFKMWKRLNISFEVKQSSSENIDWALRFWQQGKREADPSKRSARFGKNFHKKTKGTGWQTVNFKVASKTPADGFDLEIKGPAGTEITIRNLSIWRMVYDGYARKVIRIPKGRIWRAVVDVGNMTELFINGREISSSRIILTRPVTNVTMGEKYRFESLDITNLLKPGQDNCIGVYGVEFGGAPPIVLHGSIIMVSGKRIELGFDKTWQWNVTAPEGWSFPDFDASGWEEIGKTKKVSLCGAGGLIYRRRTDRPCYDGLLLLKNPDDSNLFFTESAPVAIRALVPRGLQDSKPVIEWSLFQYQDGNFSKLAVEKVSEYKLRVNSLRFVLDCGKHKAGVYLLKTVLRDGAGKVLEDRIPEPLVVVGHIPMRETLGETYEQGMDLKLETEIDLTNPDDKSAPWMEVDGKNVAQGPRWKWTKNKENPINDPIIVEKDGLKYRETRPVYGAQISYLVSFKHPGDFYLMVLEYPNNRRRLMGVSCTSEAQGLGENGGSSRCGPSVWTGDKCPITNKMEALKWVYRSEPGNHAVNIMSLQKYVPAAASKLRIYHIKNGLPALKVPKKNTRWFGLFTESCTEKRGIGRTFGITKEPPPKNGLEAMRRRNANNKSNPILTTCKMMETMLDTAVAHTKYLRFTGQNLYTMGCYHAHDGNNAFIPQPDSGETSIQPDFRDVLVRVFRENGIDFLASVEMSMTMGLWGWGLEDISKGRDYMKSTYYFVDKNGDENRFWEGRYGFNFNHPEVRKWIYALADNLAEKYKTLPNFKGVNWSSFFTGSIMPSYHEPYSKNAKPLDLGYSDPHIALFEKETGIQIPVDPNDPDRYNKRYQFLTSAKMIKLWKNWRAAKVAELFKVMRENIRKIRPDLIVLANLMIYHNGIQECREQNMSMRQYLYDWGWNVELFKEYGIPLPQYVDCRLSTAAGNKPGYPYAWEANQNPEYYKLFDADTRDRLAVVHHAWLEMENFAGLFPKKPHWPRPGQSTMQWLPCGDNAGAEFMHLLIGTDPSIVYFGFSDVSLLIGGEQPLRRFAQVLRTLPTEKFSLTADTGMTTNLVIRELRKDGKLYFYVVNPGYWPIKGKVNIKGAATVTNLVTGANVLSAKTSSSKQFVPIDLKPYSAVSFVTDTDTARITGWSNKPVPDSDLVFLRMLIDKTDRYLKAPAARIVLTPKDDKFMFETVKNAQKALKQGKYAKAWHLTTQAKFWILLHDYLEKAALFATEKKRIEIDPDKVRTMIAQRTDSPPVIDGKSDDNCWRKVENQTGFMTVSNDKSAALAQTSVLAAHDDKNLYLNITCRDKQPDGIRKTALNEKEVFASKDDAVSIFIRPDPESSTYYQMAFNAAGTKFDQKVVGGARNYDFAPPWEVKTLETKDGWTAEIKLPADSLKAKIEKGRPWQVNVYRMFRCDSLPVSSWSPIKGSAHNIQNLGVLCFN